MGRVMKEPHMISLEQMQNTTRMRAALQWIYEAVRKNTRAVSRVAGETLPDHELVIVAKADGGTADDLIQAIERNLGAIGALVPAEHVTIVPTRFLDQLLKAIPADPTLGPSILRADDLHFQGLSILDAWSQARGREIDDSQQR